MKQAKQQSETHRHSICGDCSRSIKIRSGKQRIACTAHLAIMPASHEADCEEFLPAVANDAVAQPGATADGAKDDAATQPAEAS